MNKVLTSIQNMVKIEADDEMRYLIGSYSVYRPYATVRTYDDDLIALIGPPFQLVTSRHRRHIVWGPFPRWGVPRPLHVIEATVGHESLRVEEVPRDRYLTWLRRNVV